MNRQLASFLGGLLFALGLGVSGMTDANKVIGFLNLAGDWDPSLAFVMVGAIGVHLGLLRLILRRGRPLFDDTFHIPTRRDLDLRLTGGAALFGVGWGLGGFCPGPGLVSLAGFGAHAFTFVVVMLSSMSLYELLQRDRKAVNRRDVAPC